MPGRWILSDAGAEAAYATLLVEESPGVVVGSASMRQRDVDRAASGSSCEFAAGYAPSLWAC